MAGSVDEVKLLGEWPSLYVHRVRIALELKGVSCEYLEQGVQGVWVNKTELLLKYNPVHKKVPVLIHKGRPICESAIVLQYIDEVWAGTGPSILPSDPYERALARFWAGYVDEKWFPASTKIMKVKTEEEKVEAVEQSLAGLSLLEEVYEKSSKGKPFFGGDNVGYLDIVLGSALCWEKTIEKISGIKLIDETKFPLLAAWAERFSAIAIVKEVTPETDKLVEFWKEFQAIRNATASNN